MCVCPKVRWSIYEHAKGQPWQLLTPRIGEPIRLNEQQTFEKWW